MAIESANLSRVRSEVLACEKPYTLIGTLQQAQAFCSYIGRDYSVFLYPDSPYEIAARLDDPYRSDNRVRIIVLDDPARARDIPSSAGHLTFILADTVYNSEGGYAVSKILDPKTKAAAKLAKIHTPIDLRKVNLVNVPAHVQKYYAYFPRTAAGLADLTPAEVDSIWDWTNNNSVVVSYFESLIDGDLQRWGQISSGDLFRILHAFDSNKSPDKRVPVIIQTAEMFIRPFLDYAISKGSEHYGRVMLMFATWVALSTNKWSSRLTPGLVRKVSKKNYEYITLQPSSISIQKWVELIQVVLL